MTATKIIQSLLLTLAATLPLCATAQMTFYQKNNNDSLSTHSSPIVTKRFGRSAILLTMAEAIPFSVNTFVRHADFSNISIKTIGHNFTPGSWTWDDDDFGTNQFGHPYHGSQFFSAFRANGYSFWQAAPAAIAGSYIWETVAEKQYPSTNDFINTSFGGIVLGEMTYRLSNKIVNNRSHGFNRQLSEVFALIINPMNGFTRILDGKWGKITGNTAERDSSAIATEFDIGLRKINTGKPGDTFGWYGRIKLSYGTAFQNYKTPFSNIAINAEFAKDDSSKMSNLSVYGSLNGWRIRSSESFNHLAVLSANYEYIHNQAFFYSAQSVKFNFYSELKLPGKIKFNTQFGAGPVILGAVPDNYTYRGRNYDYGSGIGVNAIGGLSFNKLFYTFSYRGGWLKTINGNASHYLLHTLSNEIGYRVMDKLSLCAESGYFALHGHYRDYNNVNKATRI